MKAELAPQIVFQVAGVIRRDKGRVIHMEHEFPRLHIVLVGPHYVEAPRPGHGWSMPFNRFLDGSIYRRTR